MNKKEELQALVVELSKVQPNLLLEHATGAGKTLSALKIIDNCNSPLTWKIILAERLHKNNWLEDMKKHNKEHLLDKIEFICYASFHTLKDSNINIVFDEAHHLSDNNASILNTITSDRILLLTAKLTKSELDLYERAIRKKIYKHKYSITDAVNDELLPEPKIIVYKLKLDDKQLRHKVSFKKNGKVYKETILTDLGYYNNLDNKINYFRNIYETTGYQQINYNKWMRAALNRKNFIASLKTTTTSNIINIFRELKYRFICYYNSVKDAKTLSPKDCVIFSDKRTAKQNSNVVYKFNNLEINELHTCKMAQESLNFTQLEAGLLVQLDSKSRKGIQTTGRTLRHDFPIMVIIVIERTQDEKYLSNFLEDNSSDFVVFVDNIKDLKEHVRN